MTDVDRLLILGDGDFSFAVSVAGKVQRMPMTIHITATSFDDQRSLFSKYPNAAHNIKILKSLSYVSVIHNVDATSLYSSFDSTMQFSLVVFNFPHLGRDMALRNGMILINEKTLSLQDWPGYELKRHQSGKSFQTKVEVCKHYCFRKQLDFNAMSLCSISFTAIQSLFCSVGSNIDPLKAPDMNDSLHDGYADSNSYCATENIDKIVASIGIDTNTTSSSSIIISSGDTGSTNKGGGKKRKIDKLTQGFYCKKLGVENSSNISWECSVCPKTFSTEMGAKYHAYAVHVLGGDNGKRTEKTTVDNRGGSNECRPAETATVTTTQEFAVAEHIAGASYLGDCVSPVDILHSNSSSSNNSHHDSAVINADLVAGTSNSIAINKAATRLVCTHCDKSFQSRNALTQHSLALHGKYLVPRPMWAAGTSVTLEGGSTVAVDTLLDQSQPQVMVVVNDECSHPPSPDVLLCAICGYSTDNAECFAIHSSRRLFQPPSVEATQLFRCAACTRSFQDERALRQHANHCESG